MILILILTFAWISWIAFLFYTVLQIIVIANGDDCYDKPVFFATCIFPNIMFLITLCCLTTVA